MSRKRNFVLEDVYIEDYAAEGKCIAHANEKVLFVEGAVPGDIADVFVRKNKSQWAEGNVKQFKKLSENRTDAFCDHFGTCGGCKWQMLPYPFQLKYKEQQVRDQLQRIGNIHPDEFLPIIACEQTREYRNKMEFTFSNKQYIPPEKLDTDERFDKNVLGFHAPRLFDKIIDIETCHLQKEPTNAIKNFIREYAGKKDLSFQDIRMHKGLLRNLIIRINKEGEVLVNLVFGDAKEKEIEELCLALNAEFPQIVSLYYTLNTKANDSIYDLTPVHFSGEKYLRENLDTFQFDISPKSFFQTNSYQAERLYRVIKDFAEPNGNETVYDLYCGTGSIGIFLSRNIKKLIGVETLQEAVEDARRNAEINQIQNTFFFTGDVMKVCNQDFFEKNGQPDIIILDPPRAGCHQKLLEKLLEIKPSKIIYVSCNPATQARDVKILSDQYKTVKSQAVDMFPQTHHIENVLQLTLK